MDEPLEPWQRQVIDGFKSDRPQILHWGRHSGKTHLMSILVSERAKELGGIDLLDARTGIVYHVPSGTPPAEALPVRIKD